MAVVADSIEYRFVKDTHGHYWKIPVLIVGSNTTSNILAPGYFEGTLFYTTPYNSTTRLMPYNNGDTVFNFEGLGTLTLVKNQGSSSNPYFAGHNGASDITVIPGVKKAYYQTSDNNYGLTPFAILKFPNGRIVFGNWTGSGFYNYVTQGWILPTNTDLGFYTCPTGEWTTRQFAQSNSTTTQSTAKYIYDNGRKTLPTDPYDEVPPSETGGGEKPYDPFSTDNIDYELLPEVSAVGTGFISLWCPTEQQMLNLSAYMWNADVLTLDFWRKLVADPIQLVYGLNIIPLDLRAKGIVGNTPDTVVVGAISTGIKMDYLTSQWVELDCGTIDIDESMLGSYLDYDPFTKVDIYLPYIGYRPLRVDDIMPGTIRLKYRVDLLTGACVAQIKSTKSNEHDDTLNSIVYQYMGNCATQIPVTASQYADAVRSAITTAAAVGTIAVLAGTGAGAGIAAAGAEIMPGTQSAGLLGGPGMVPVDSELGASMARYSQMTSVPSIAESSGGANTLKQAGIIHSAASAGGNVMGIKPSIERSGAIGGAAGMLATQMPYLVFTRPRIAHPEDQNKYTGYPSFMTKKLSELSGFTQVQAIHLEGIPCTANELAEIDALLKSGVIF